LVEKMHAQFLQREAFHVLMDRYAASSIEEGMAGPMIWVLAMCE